MELNEIKIIRYNFVVRGSSLRWTGVTDRADTTNYAFFVFVQKWKNWGLMYEYGLVQKEILDAYIAGDEILKNPFPLLPKEEYAVTYEKFLSKVDEFPKRYSSRERNEITKMEMDGKVEDYGLWLPEHYIVEEPKIVMTISDSIKRYPNIENLRRKNIGVYLSYDMDIEPEESNHGDYYQGEMPAQKVYCANCGKIVRKRIISNSYKCPECGADFYEMIVDKKFKEHQKKQFMPYSSNCHNYAALKSSRRTLYVMATDKRVEILRLQHELESYKGTIKNTLILTNRMVHDIDGEMKCYKVKKNGTEEECDAVHALGINTKTIANGPEAVFEDSFDIEEFIQKNEKTMRMIGFMELLKYAKKDYSTDSLFFAYITIVNAYPIVEQIVKMGHVNLFFSLYERLKQCGNVKNLLSEVEKLEELVNCDATKGKDAMRFPAYIGDYLIRKNADLKEYYVWRDIYELTQISKENFDSITNSFGFSLINSQCDLSSIGNILKYGYSLEKLFNYIMKTYMDESNRFEGLRSRRPFSLEYTIHILGDYLEMCEVLGIQPDLYPQDLRKQHNDVNNIRIEEERKAQEAREQKELEEQLKREQLMRKASLDTEEYLKAPERNEDGKLPVGIPRNYDEYVVVMPKTKIDFVNEGNAQHNCVGGYYNRVIKNECIVFFLRKKDAPEKSFITGECKNGQLGQFYLSNNRTVHDDNLMKIGRYIAKQIDQGIRSGKIASV